MSSVLFDASACRTGLSRLRVELVDAGRNAMRAAVRSAYDSARTTTLFKDGPDAALRRSIGYVLTFTLNQIAGKLRASSSHARFVNDGTPPHVIRARGNGMLRFTVAGQTIFRKQVRHPGTKPRPFMDVAAAVGEQTLDYGLEIYADEAIARFNHG